MKDEKIEQGTVFDVVLDGLVLMALNSHYCNHLLFENQIKMIMNRVSTETFYWHCHCYWHYLGVFLSQSRCSTANYRPTNLKIHHLS